MFFFPPFYMVNLAGYKISSKRLFFSFIPFKSFASPFPPISLPPTPQATVSLFSVSKGLFLFGLVLFDFLLWGIKTFLNLSISFSM